MLKRTLLTWGATLMALALTASSALGAPAAQQGNQATPTPVAVDTFDPAAAGGRTVVKWYVGLGTGTNPAQVETQQACGAGEVHEAHDRETIPPAGEDATNVPRAKPQSPRPVFRNDP